MFVRCRQHSLRPFNGRQAAAKHALLDNVVFTGRVPKAEVPDLIASMDACLVHLCRQRLFRTVIPTKIFEAASVGSINV